MKRKEMPHRITYGKAVIVNIVRKLGREVLLSV